MRYKVKVIPNAKQNEVVFKKDEIENGCIIVKVTAPAEKGKANREVLRILSGKFGSKVRIVSGERGREKLARFLNLAADYFK
jgi:uncharacterized protein (TIGR00251 family)